MQPKNLYAVLGINPDAGQTEIKKAYRNLALQYHPDTNNGKSGNEEKLKEINEAYSILGNEEKRRQYDLLNRMGSTQAFAFETRPSMDRSFGRPFCRGLGKGMGRGGRCGRRGMGRFTR